MVAFLPQHIAELSAAILGLSFVTLGVVLVLRARTAPIYREGVRVFSAYERPPGPMARRLSSGTLRVFGLLLGAVGVVEAWSLSRPQRECPYCMEHPWGSLGWIAGTIAVSSICIVLAAIRLRRAFFPPANADEHPT